MPSVVTALFGVDVDDHSVHDVVNLVGADAHFQRVGRLARRVKLYDSGMLAPGNDVLRLLARPRA